MASPSNIHARTPSTATTGTSDIDNPQNLVITSLRGQVSDLVSQVTQLNSKLVQSYDRISDLEDNLHISSSTLRNSTLKISQLELERTHHLSALNTGLLVEKSHVTTELTRLMERATDEAARRGKAESARQEIEKDLDDLSAELFGRANTMVAEARLAQAKSERRVQDAETVLKGAEDAVASMQSQMQVLREEKDRTDNEIANLRELMGKGKWIERERSSPPALSLRLLSTHAPYQEFLLFVAHLRQIRPGTPQPPPIATLLPLPFLSRLVSEDSDPTLRLDAAPALNWLTRRSVNAAIHQLQLTIEPVSASSLLEMLTPPASAAALAAFSSQSPPAPAAPAVILCALCGTPVLPSSGSSMSQQQSTPSSWRPSFFTRTNSTSVSTPPTSTPHIHSPTPSVATSSSFYPPSASSRLSPPPTPPPVAQPQIQVHVFRVPAAGAGPPTLYPLCTSGWCLARLRTTCEVWRFVRRGVVEKVWAEEIPGVQLEHASTTGATAGTAKPPVPPRRRMNMGKLIGFASSALGMEKGGAAAKASGTDERFSPPPVMNRRVSGERRSRSGTIAGGVPPPLPRRSDVRGLPRSEEEKRDQMHVESKHVEVVEKPVPTPIEGAMLFDADSTKPDDHHTLENGHADPTLKDDPFIASTKAVDPAQIPLPMSPTFPPKQMENSPQEHVQQPEAEQIEKNEQQPPRMDPNFVTKEEKETSTQLSTTSPNSPSQAPPATNILGPLVAHTASPVPSRTVSPPPVPRRAPRRAAPTLPNSTSKVSPELTADTTPSPSPGHTDSRNVPSVEDGTKTHISSITPHPVDDPPRYRDARPKTPEDHEPYIGDVTWEERTWKELVRLREDMFYARIGTAR